MITFLTLLAAIVPGFLICYLFIRLDKYEKEPLLLLSICGLLGVGIFFVARFFEGYLDGLVTPYVVANNLNPNTHFGTLFFAAFVRTAFVEEILKLAILLALPFQRKEFNEPMDGIVYAVMIGMGFAIMENLVYCLPYDIALAVVRNFTAVPSHAVFAVIMGYYIGLAKFNRAKRIKYILIGFFLTVGVHGLYDIFLFQEYENWLMILATFVLLGGVFFSRIIILRHQEDSPFRKKVETTSITVTETIIVEELELPPQNQPSKLKEEDNEILSAVLFEMKIKEEKSSETSEEE